MFHQHKWTEAERFYAEPFHTGVIEGKFQVSFILAQQMLFGVTTIKLTCAECGDTKTHEILGKSLKV